VALHVVPADEDHELRPTCHCAPDVDRVRRGDGTFGLLVWHWPQLDNTRETDMPEGGSGGN
jgi:hypothetical protein